MSSFNLLGCLELGVKWVVGGWCKPISVLSFGQAEQKLLRKPQVGKGIFTLLATTVLPALISALIPK